MTNNESQQKPKSTSSNKTENPTQYEAVLELGCKLVDELNLEPSVDTLGRWMAHYIADLINKAENAVVEDKQIVEKKCFDEILQLWKHRAELPNGKRPFEELEPIIHAIESLNPSNRAPRYHRHAQPEKDQTEDESEVTKWLEVADSIDHSARILIGYSLTEAARATSDKTKGWVKHAEVAGTNDSAYEIAIRFITDQADRENEPDPNAEVRQQLKERIEYLEYFTKAAKTVAAELNAHYKALPAPNEDDTSGCSSTTSNQGI